ncbi:MANSC domain-containing protein 4 [Protopterus annectens]|uniref:MANSC domain-containing protein 4 n=1 Tax=Protopterus annectens TaxID=7888 RepID=UPI001CF94D0F|nr:MANSC domain-containing protein 4 [Protopterus annectens]
MFPTSLVLLIIGLFSGLESRCSSTIFYKNCWIQRFPGFFIDIIESQKKGAQLIKLYRETSAQQCSRKCCLSKNVSCNLAIFYFETTKDSSNCFHLNCPVIESCLLRTTAHVILYNITEGIDPDLLVFGTYPTKDRDSDSSSSWTSLTMTSNNSRTPVSDRRKHSRLSFSPPPFQSSSQAINLHTAYSSYDNRSAMTGFPAVTSESAGRSVAVNRVTRRPKVTSSPKDGTSVSTQSTPVALVANPFSDVHIPAQLDSSKQQPNATKGHSGKNNTSVNENGTLRPTWITVSNTLLIPVVLSTIISFICYCTILLAASHRKRKRGHYKPVWKGESSSTRMIRYAIIKDNL